MYDKPTTRRKSPEILELERMANADLIHRFRDEDPRFTSGKRFSDNTNPGLISCILAYLFLMGGRGERSKNFVGIEAKFHGYSLTIRVDAGPGKAEFTETRETVELTVHTFAQAKNFLDQM